jgi:hypothetical protein
MEQGKGFLAIMDATPGGLYSSRTFDCSHDAVVVIAESSGVISDGDGDYSAHAACRWIIAPPAADGVSLVFTRFDTEQDYDTVEVEACADPACPDGWMPVPGSPFSGVLHALPRAVSVQASVLRVSFAADGRVQRPGFRAAFVASALVPCAAPALFAGANDGGAATVEVRGPAVLIGGAYRPNSECEWVMARTAAGDPLKLSFLQFETERGFDFVHVDECAEGSGRVRGAEDGGAAAAAVVARQVQTAPSSKQQRLAREFH